MGSIKVNPGSGFTYLRGMSKSLARLAMGETTFRFTTTEQISGILSSDLSLWTTSIARYLLTPGI